MLREQSVTEVRCRLLAGVAAIAIAAVSNAKQATAQQPIALPGIVVEGATLAKPAPKPQVAPVAAAPQPAVSQAPTVTQATAGGGGQAQAAAASAAQGNSAGAAGSAPAAANQSGSNGYPAETVGSSVTVVTGEDLVLRQVRNAAEALRSLPGVSVTRNSTPGSVTEVRIRGAENNHTLVLIDGVAANDPTNGGFDFSDISADNIERIEVIRGAHSVIYGSGAVGGVVNIVTRGGRGPARVTVRTEGGSFGTRDASLGVSGGSERIWGAASYHVRDVRGFNIAPDGSERDGSRLETFGLRGGVAIAPGLTVDSSLRYSRKAGDRDGFGNAQPLALATALDDPSRYTSDVMLGSVRARWETFGGGLVQELRTTYNKTETTDKDLSFPDFPFLSHYVSQTRTHSYLATVQLPGAAPALFKHSLSGLTEWQEELFQPLGDLTDGLTRKRDRQAFAGEWRATVGDQLDVTAGVRRDDNSAFDDFTSWRTSASWRVQGTGLRPHASAGTGFKAPTFFEQFGTIPAFFSPNPALVPETSFGWDAGLEMSFLGRRVILDVTYFAADLENKISRNRAGFAPTLVNLPGTSSREGVEIEGKFVVLPGMTVGASYTYLEARDSDGQHEVRRPPHGARVDLDVRLPGSPWRLHLDAIYNSGNKDLAFRTGAGMFAPWTTEIVQLDSVLKVNAAASYDVARGIEVFGRLENIFDTRPQEVYGFSQPGAAAFGGVKLTFGGDDGALGKDK